MEFPSLGKQCSLKSCAQLDFLPILCSFCKSHFCKDHIVPDSHSCEEYLKIAASERKNVVLKIRYPCHFNDCKQWELTPVSCFACSLTFCLQHRHQIDHDCRSYEAPVNPMAEATIKLNEITSKMADKPSRKISKKSEKTAAKVQLMKLKMKAMGQSGIPTDDRIYFLVYLPKKANKNSSLPVFVSKHWSTGRVIDSIAEQSKVTNNNNVNTADKLLIFRKCDGVKISDTMDEILLNLLNNEIIINGQSIILEYIPHNEDREVLENPNSYE